MGKMMSFTARLRPLPATSRLSCFLAVAEFSLVTANRTKQDRNRGRRGVVAANRGERFALLGLAPQSCFAEGLGEAGVVGQLEPPAVQSSPYRARLHGAAVRQSRTFGLPTRGALGEEGERRTGKTE